MKSLLRAVVRTDHLKQRFIRVKEEDKLEIIVIKIDIRIGIDKTVAIGEFHIEEDFSGRGRSKSRERQYLGNFRRNERSSSRSRSGSRASTNRNRIRCFKCREYDQFAKDCLNISDTEKEEQIQQMLNLEEDKTSIKVLEAETYEDLIRANLEETIDHLNL